MQESHSGESEETARLVARCNAGDERAWDEFYSRYAAKTAAAVKRLWAASSMSDIEDVVQGVFINLMKALPHYDPSRPVEAYIIDIARKTAISLMRHEGAKKRGSGNPGHRGGPGPDASISVLNGALCASRSLDAETQMVMAEEREILSRALDSLSERCRELIRRRYSEGLSYAEISHELDEKETTLRVRLQRCLKSLGEAYHSSLAVKGATR